MYVVIMYCGNIWNSCKFLPSDLKIEVYLVISNMYVGYIISMRRKYPVTMMSCIEELFDSFFCIWMHWGELEVQKTYWPWRGRLTSSNFLLSLLCHRSLFIATIMHAHRYLKDHLIYLHDNCTDLLLDNGVALCNVVNLKLSP